MASIAAATVAIVGITVAAVAQLTSGDSLPDAAAGSTAGATRPDRATGPSESPAPQQVVPASPVTPAAQPTGAAGPSASSGATPPGSTLAGQAERIAGQLPTVAEPVRVASFNMLGASHTRGRHARPGYAGGVPRARQAAALAAAQQLDVIGAQEFEPSQRRTFARQLPGYDSYPGDAGKGIEGTNTIAWRADRFRLVAARSVAIPYFGGYPVRMPFVLLEDITSGQRIWFANFHNPADVHGPAQQWREQATRIQADLANQLGADGTPVVMTGDFNERAPFFCRLVARAPAMKSASGATGGPQCTVPPHPEVDWILGSAPVTFDGYQELDGGLVDRITDHPVIVANVHVAPTVRR